MSAEVETVELLIARQCVWKKREGNRKGCERCGLPKLHPDHMGGPPSMNNHSIDRQAFASVKEAWHRVLAEALVESGLRRGLESVDVQIRIGFPTYVERDEGNHRWMVEKAFGDTLVGGYVKTKTVRGQTVHETVIEGGWLPADSFWPTRRYSMGSLEGTHTPGESWVRLLVFGSMVPPVPDLHARDREKADSAQQTLL